MDGTEATKAEPDRPHEEDRDETIRQYIFRYGPQQGQSIDEDVDTEQGAQDEHNQRKCPIHRCLLRRYGQNGRRSICNRLYTLIHILSSGGKNPINKGFWEL